jgi:hypothetical protein
MDFPVRQKFSGQALSCHGRLGLVGLVRLATFIACQAFFFTEERKV